MFIPGYQSCPFIGVGYQWRTHLLDEVLRVDVNHILLDLLTYGVQKTWKLSDQINVMLGILLMQKDLSVDEMSGAEILDEIQ